MTFTQAELAALERLRKYQRQWRFLRWGMLLAGAVSAVAFAGDAYRLFALVSRVSQHAPAVASRRRPRASEAARFVARSVVRWT